MAGRAAEAAPPRARLAPRTCACQIRGGGGGPRARAPMSEQSADASKQLLGHVPFAHPRARSRL
eukprot:809700-Pyramimonas_sp.AAC.1